MKHAITLHSGSQYLLISLLLLSLNACVTTQTPKISHVHVGHALTGWHGTPNEQGLFVTAEQEAQIALEHAQYALANIQDVNKVKMHIRHVQQALDATLYKEGPGLGYGFIRAIGEARDHLIFAAESDDASDNIKQLAKQWELSINNIVEQSQLILRLSHELLASKSSDEITIFAEEIESLCRDNINGMELDGDGIKAHAENELGLVQLRQQLQIVIDKEDPKYETVDKKYLFGLIRLPSGKWAFDFNKSSNSNNGGYDY